jgi:hypothetical protein
LPATENAIDAFIAGVCEPDPLVVSLNCAEARSVPTKNCARIDPTHITSDQSTEKRKWPPIIFSFAIAYGAILATFAWLI